MKNSRKFQANVTGRHSSLSKRSRMFRQNLLKVCTCEKVESLEAHYCTCAPSQVIFKVYDKIVFAPIYWSAYIKKPVCVLYSTHNVYSYSLSAWDGKRKKNKS